MTNQAGKKKLKNSSFAPPAACGGSWWAARHMKRHVKKRNPEASLGCTGFCDLIFKGSASASSQDQNPQTNKALKMRYVQRGAEFPGNMPSRSPIEKHRLFDLFWGFFAVDSCSLCLKDDHLPSRPPPTPTLLSGLPYRCSSALGRFEQYGDRAVRLVQGGLLVIRRHGGG